MSAFNDPKECTISFQGFSGAYSHLACRAMYPNMIPLPCDSFEEAFDAVAEGRACYAMIPVENSVAGRVADIHHLLPESKLHIVAEHFQPIHHHLLAPKGATLDTIRSVYSHVHALSQCRIIIRELKIRPVVAVDTAGAAADLAKSGDITKAAIASELAGEIYGLISLRANIEDASHNTTRFLIMAREPIIPDPTEKAIITSFVFRVHNVPAALHKALGVFARHGVNMTKLESYLVDGDFIAAQFYADVEGHPADPNVNIALAELASFARDNIKILGVYPAHSYRFHPTLSPRAIAYQIYTL